MTGRRVVGHYIAAEEGHSLVQERRVQKRFEHLEEFWKHLKYLSADKREDVHLASVGVFHRGDNEAGSTESDLALRPAVHRQRQLPFPNIVHPRQLHTLRTAHTARLTWRKRKTPACYMLMKEIMIISEVNLKQTVTDFWTVLFLALWDFVNQLCHTGRLSESESDGERCGYVSEL